MIDKSLKQLLEKKFRDYNNFEFIDSDPIQVPHLFFNKEDIEIAAFLTSTIAWGQRISIIKNAKALMKLMDDSPYDFICNSSDKEIKIFGNFVHRTFQPVDCIFFIEALKDIYKNHNGLESVFNVGFEQNSNIFGTLAYFRNIFFSIPHPARTVKHVADVNANASAKRLNMFLRWMVRKDDAGVDFGLWNKIHPSALMLPLDIHSGRIARSLNLLTRKQDDWKAVEEITQNLRIFDPIDPVKYDFALFGMGVFENAKF